MNILNKREKEIVKHMQSYLIECEQGKIHSMTPDIDEEFIDQMLTELGLSEKCCQMPDCLSGGSVSL